MWRGFLALRVVLLQMPCILILLATKPLLSHILLRMQLQLITVRGRAFCSMITQMTARRDNPYKQRSYHNR